MKKTTLYMYIHMYMVLGRNNVGVHEMLGLMHMAERAGGRYMYVPTPLLDPPLITYTVP